MGEKGFWNRIKEIWILVPIPLQRSYSFIYSHILSCLFEAQPTILKVTTIISVINIFFSKALFTRTLFYEANDLNIIWLSH